MPLRLFHHRNVVGANVIQAFLVAGMFGMFFLGALYLQRVLGYDALEVGLAFLPTTVVMGTMSLGFSEKLIMRFGPRTTLIPGVIMVGIGLLLFARTPVDGDYLTDLLAPLLLIGFGVGTSFPSLMTLAMSGATPEDSGLASGVVSTSMQVGGAIGLAVLATLAAQRTDNQLADGAGQLAALNSGYHLAYVIGAILVGIAVVVAVTVLREVPLPSPEEMAEHSAGRGRGRARARLLGGLSEAPLDEAALDRVVGQLQRPPVGLRRLVVAAEAAQQVGAGAVQWLVAVEALDRLDQLQAGVGPSRHRHGDGVVELDHRARCDLQVPGVEAGDARPSRSRRRSPPRRGRPRSAPGSCTGRPARRPLPGARARGPRRSAPRSQSERSWSSSSTSSPAAVDPGRPPRSR